MAAIASKAAMQAVAHEQRDHEHEPDREHEAGHGHEDGEADERQRLHRATDRRAEQRQQETETLDQHNEHDDRDPGAQKQRDEAPRHELEVRERPGIEHFDDALADVARTHVEAEKHDAEHEARQVVERDRAH